MRNRDDDWMGLLPEDDEFLEKPGRTEAAGTARRTSERNPEVPHSEAPLASDPDADESRVDEWLPYESPTTEPQAAPYGAVPAAGASTAGAGAGEQPANEYTNAADDDHAMRSTTSAPTGAPTSATASTSSTATTGPATHATTASPIRRRSVVVGAGALVVVLLLLGFALGPQVVRNLATSVVAEDTPVTLTSGDDQVTVIAPAGWHLVRPLGSDGEVALESPDGLVEFTLTLTQRPEAEAPPTNGSLSGYASDIGEGEWSVEPPSPETIATYARIDQPEDFGGGGLFGTGLFSDGSPEHAGVIAAVAPEPPRASGAVVDVLGTSDVAIESYLGEFARIVATVEFAS